VVEITKTIKMEMTKNTQNISKSNANKGFLNAIGLQFKNQILNNIANHYRITPEEAYEEVTTDGTENILEYINGSGSRLIALTLWNNYLLSKNN
jgi:hypothetical protein